MRCPATGKRLHAELREAERQARKDGIRYDAPMRAYHCTHCGGYHVGHDIGWNQRARAIEGRKVKRWLRQQSQNSSGP